jgi:hypothetical protein
LAGIFLTISSVASANETNPNLETFAKAYFEKMIATQLPQATEEDIETYLAVLTEDVGHSHLPWVVDDSRLPDGKQSMREGMLFYLGSHTEYKAELLDLFTFNTSAIAIRYRHQAKGIHPQNNQKIEYSEIMMEVLEMEDGKVAVIRKYHE